MGQQSLGTGVVLLSSRHVQFIANNKIYYALLSSDFLFSSCWVSVLETPLLLMKIGEFLVLLFNCLHDMSMLYILQIFLEFIKTQSVKLKKN